MIKPLALLLTNFLNPHGRTEFMEKFGPETVQRIALTRDDAGALQIIVSDSGGPLRDGATEIIQAAELMNEDGRRSYLLTTQVRTDALGELTADEMRQIAAFLESYFSGTQRDVVLSAKADIELAITETFYIVVTDGAEEVKFQDVSRWVGDYVMRFGWVYGYTQGKVYKIDPAQLDANLDNGVAEPLFQGSDNIAVIGIGAKLVRGSGHDLQVGGKNVTTIAYLKQEDDGTGTMMTFLESDGLEEIYSTTINSAFATFTHDGTMLVMVGNVIDEDDKEAFIVTRVPSTIITFSATA